jgi:hypothetical protein
MMKKSLWLASMLAAFLLAAGTVRAQSVDDKIQALEQELSQLKEQQVELKKEATAAAAAMPSFSYRPGNGLNIEAADKSWSFRPTLEAHVRMYFMDGKDQVGRTKGELELRRFRPGWFFCIDNCLWEMEATLDIDGFGGSGVLQRGQISFHGENINPWLPTLNFGGDVSTTMGTLRQGSGAVGSQADYDLLSRSNGFNTGSSGWGIVFNWDDKSLSGIGIPGRINRFQLAYAIAGKGSDDVQINTDRKDFSTFLGIDPFSQVKNKWISGLRFEYGAWFCQVDDRAQAGGSCNRNRFQENENAGKQVMIDTNRAAALGGISATIGRGVQVFQMLGLGYTVGPYQLRLVGGFQQHDGGNNSVITEALKTNPKSNMFLIGHELFVWSPKGFLTGSPNTTGSILLGTHFERDNMDLGCVNGSTACFGAGAPNNGEYHRVRVLVREWDAFYFVAPRMSIGAHFVWYDSSNLRAANGQACPNITGKSVCRVGAGADWTNLSLNWRYTF